MRMNFPITLISAFSIPQSVFREQQTAEYRLLGTGT